MDLITKTDEIVVSFLDKIEKMDTGINEIIKNSRQFLNGERYLSDKEVSLALKISRRTLQDYRSEGKMPYYLIGGKVLYKESDIEKMLLNNFCEHSH
ncbi:MAG: helix-turn-helix domain-containing protein [Candidatus Symbiothrix sp.]|jgi:excisionase family DNA binding protein|nr:helix-turn-helix domain-containing protein [Candidatus Symbiothrix sp.]